MSSLLFSSSSSSSSSSLLLIARRGVNNVATTANTTTSCSITKNGTTVLSSAKKLMISPSSSSSSSSLGICRNFHHYHRHHHNHNTISRITINNITKKQTTRRTTTTTTTTTTNSSGSTSSNATSATKAAAPSPSPSTSPSPASNSSGTSTVTKELSSSSSSSTTAVSSSSAAKQTSSSSSGGSSGGGGVPILQTFGAMTMGVLTVTFGAYAVESLTSNSVPSFNPSHQRYDQSTFKGRFYTMILKCDPKLLLYTKEECQLAKDMVDNWEKLKKEDESEEEGGGGGGGGGGKDVDRKLWEAQRIYTAALHPDTGEIVPAPFRMSGYVPFNGPICVAMVASTTTTTLLFWNWVNQTQNALVNYFNRNAASGQLSNQTLAISYGAAVGSALTVAFGLSTFIQKRYDASTARKLLRFVAFPCSVVASSLNCYIVRSPEIQTGIPVTNKNGQNVLQEEEDGGGGTSQIAAKMGVYSTTASRALLQAPVYFVPPLLLTNIPYFRNLLIIKPEITVPLTTFLLLVSFGIGLPATVAIFPQLSSVDVKELESKYHNLIDEDGKPITKVYYNKGL